MLDLQWTACRTLTTRSEKSSVRPRRGVGALCDITKQLFQKLSNLLANSRWKGLNWLTNYARVTINPTIIVKFA